MIVLLRTEISFIHYIIKGCSKHSEITVLQFDTGPVDSRPAVTER